MKLFKKLTKSSGTNFIKCNKVVNTNKIWIHKFPVFDQLLLHNSIGLFMIQFNIDLRIITPAFIEKPHQFIENLRLFIADFVKLAI